MADFLQDDFLTTEFLDSQPTPEVPSMADGSIGIKTYRDDETKIILVDGASGTTATNKLSIQKQGDAIVGGTNDFGVPVFGKDASGNYKLLEFTANGLSVDPGTVTVEATALDIRPLTNADVVTVEQGTNPWVVSATAFDIRPLTFATDSVDVSGSSVFIDDNGGSITVDATDLDIRDLSAATDSVSISDGTDTLAINTDGSLNVVISEGGTEVCAFNDFGDIANGVTETFDYVVTNGATFKGSHVLVAADGKVLVEVGTWDGVSTFTKKYAYWQQPGFNMTHAIDALNLLGDGTVAIRIAVTAKSGQSDQVYANLSGVEV